MRIIKNLSQDNIRDYLIYGSIPYNGKRKINPVECSLRDVYDIYRSKISEIGEKNNNIAIHLSGGKDTRFIAGLLKQLDIPFTGICHVFPYSNDNQIAMKLSQLLGIPMISIPINNMLWADILYEYSILDQDVEKTGVEEYYKDFDICLSGWGITEASWNVFPKLDRFFGYLHKKMGLFREKLNIYPLVFDPEIVSHMAGYEKPGYFKGNVVVDMIRNYMDKELMKLPYSHTGLSLYTPWVVINQLRRFINFYYHIRNVPNPHLNIDCSWYIRNTIPRDKMLDSINNVHDAFPVFSHPQMIDFVNSFYKRTKNIKTRLIPFITLDKVLKNVQFISPESLNYK